MSGFEHQMLMLALGYDDGYKPTDDSMALYNTTWNALDWAPGNLCSLTAPAGKVQHGSPWNNDPKVRDDMYRFAEITRSTIRMAMESGDRWNQIMFNRAKNQNKH